MVSMEPDRDTPVGETIRSFIVMDVLDRANTLEAEGRSIIHMEAGQPGAPAPQAVRAAASDALAQDKIGYTEALGQPILRRRIAANYLEKANVEVSWKRVVITTGSSAGFILAFLASLRPGARIALTAPFYPAYPNTIRALGFHPVILRSNADSNFQMTSELLEGVDEPIDAVLLASPSNPTGGMIEEGELARIAKICRDRKLTLFSDEIYHGLTYGKQERSLLELTDDAIVVNSFSKYYCMTGWRIGWMVVPDRMVRPIERLSQNLYISSPTISQIAAPYAFDCTQELEAHVEGYKRNRNYLLEKLPNIGLKPAAEPDGAFYLYCDVSHLTNESTAFCMQMLEETGVATAPGDDFDSGPFANHVRFSYAGAHEEIVEAVDRLADWLR